MDDPVGLTPQERERTHVVELEDIPEKTNGEHDEQPRVDSTCDLCINDRYIDMCESRREISATRK